MQVSHVIYFSRFLAWNSFFHAYINGARGKMPQVAGGGAQKRGQRATEREIVGSIPVRTLCLYLAKIWPS